MQILDTTCKGCGDSDFSIIIESGIKVIVCKNCGRKSILDTKEEKSIYPNPPMFFGVTPSGCSMVIGSGYPISRMHDIQFKGE